MKKEIWKDIPSYENIYQISNLGRVKSLERISGGKYYRNRIMKNTLRHDKYKVISLSKNKKQKIFYINSLVFKLFGKGE